MNPAHAGMLPVSSLLPKTWFRAVNPSFAQTAPQPSRRVTRFNPGPAVSPSFGLLYFAPDPITALFEVEALLGSVFSVSVPNPYRSAAVLAYNQIPAYRVADLGNAANRRIVESTLQEMTGEWRTYRSPYRHPAPTQALAQALHAINPAIQGFLAPSARNPDVSNLILFHNRIQRHSQTPPP